MNMQKGLERVNESVETKVQPKLTVSYRGISYPDLTQHLAQRCLITEKGTPSYVPVGSLVEKSDFWIVHDPSAQQVNQFRQAIDQYEEQFKNMLIELQGVYNSGLSFFTSSGEQVTDFRSFVFALTKQPILRAQGEAVLNKFRVVGGLEGVDIDLSIFHEYLLSYQERSPMTELSCRYYNFSRGNSICHNQDRAEEWREDIGPSSDDFRIHSTPATCDGVDCGKYENRWGNPKSLDVIISELETPLKEE
ncbi:MAG: hypothetical protein V1743_06165 [Nanoarchaeota archaeon]